MKKFCLSSTIAIFLLLWSNGNQKQTMQVNFSQIGIMKQNPGKIQAKAGSDIVVYWRIGQMGKSFPMNTIQSNQNRRHHYILVM